ncbi:MAG: UDP-N-acetylmuramate dehydrogenase [Patescibacteria group bacterium]
MIIRENVTLASLTTLRVGGDAHFVIECIRPEDIVSGIQFAKERSLPWSVLGSGSNVLAKDEQYDGVVLLVRIPGIAAVESEDTVTLSVGAGVEWDTLVREAAARELWGLENLAGIPGTVGAAPVQNIGAYGAEVKDTIRSVDVFDTEKGETYSMDAEDCAFAYRDSRFKRDSRFVILGVSFSLIRFAAPNIEYKDLQAAREQGRDLSTPGAIGDAVRAIRARKFPDLSVAGTAGSFFKNPTIPQKSFDVLKERYEALPGFPNEQGVKIPLAFILDQVLNLRGYAEGNVSLFENQPLVLVTESGATQKEIDVFVAGIAARVHDATGVTIEREVRNFPA